MARSRGAPALLGLGLAAFFLLAAMAAAEDALVEGDDDFVAPYNPEYDDGMREFEGPLPGREKAAAHPPTSRVRSESPVDKVMMPLRATLTDMREWVMGTSPKPHAVTWSDKLKMTMNKVHAGLHEAKRKTWYVLERKDVRSFKSVLLMIDVLFVMVSIQSQLDAGRERLVDYALLTKVRSTKEGLTSRMQNHKFFSKLPFVPKKPTMIQTGITHMQKATLFRKEELFTLEASMTILAALLVEKLLRIWARGERWFRRISEVVDLGVIVLSIGLEWVFHRMEHDGSLKSIKGSFLRWVTENWRFVRIVHGSYETLAHSPIIRPLLQGT